MNEFKCFSKYVRALCEREPIDIALQLKKLALGTTS